MKANEEQQVHIEDRSIALEAVDTGVKRKIMAFDDQLMLVKVFFDQGGVGSLHSHPHSQITHIESGLFEVEIDGVKKILKAGDAFYIPPDVLHGVVCLELGVLIDVFSPMREDFIKQSPKHEN